MVNPNVFCGFNELILNHQTNQNRIEKHLFVILLNCIPIELKSSQKQLLAYLIASAIDLFQDLVIKRLIYKCVLLHIYI
jgi:hypothetical protein